VCHFARAARCRLFRREVACGHCVSKGEVHYGLRGFWSRASTGPSPAPSHGGQCGREGRAPRSRRQHPGAAHRRQGLHPSPVEGRLRGRGIGLQTPLRKNMADGRHPGFARMLVKARRMAKTVIAQPAQHFSLRAHTGAGPLAPHQLGRAKNARPYCSRLPQPVCRTAATPVRGTASTVKSRT
jgi:hypothetical protein